MSKHKRTHQHQHERQGHQERRGQFIDRPRPARLSWNAAIIALALVFFGVIVLIAMTRGGETAASSAAAAGAGGDVVLRAGEFDDGVARFYRYTSAAGRDIRFFVIKSSDGVIRAAFDTCDVCYRERRGYRQAGDDMICNNCGQSFRSVNVNVLEGGCNPAPLERDVRNGQVVLTAAALEAGAWYF